MEPGESKINRIRRQEDISEAENRVTKEVLDNFQKEQSITVG